MMMTRGQPALPAPPRSRRLIGLLLALLAQILWLPLLLLRPQPSALPAKLSGLLELRLIEPRRKPAPLPPRTAAAPMAPSVPAPAQAAPSTAAEPEPIHTAPAPSTEAAPAVTAPAPLRLALPAQRPASGARPDSLLGQMLNDPRANSERRGVAFAVADAAGTLPVVTQTSTDGTDSRLIRQGSKCLRVKEFRGKIIDPMNANLRGAPSMTGHCVND